MPSSLLPLASVENKQRISNLHGSSISLALMEYCTLHRGVKLLITQDNLKALQLYNEMQFLQQDVKQEILFFPDWETLPYDPFSPHQDIISERLTTLSRIQQQNQLILIGSLQTFSHRICPPSYVNQSTLLLKKDQTLDTMLFRQQLQQAGYYAVNTVLEHGEYAVRGSILDIYPMGSKKPIRIDLFDNSIDKIRYFDTETQRTESVITEISILPAKEFPLNEDSIGLFRCNFREKFTGNPGQCVIYTSISEKRFPAGIEYYLPLFFEKTATIFDYLPKETHICTVENLPEKAEQFWQEIQQRYEQRKHDVVRPLLHPEENFLSPIAFFTLVNQFTKVGFFQGEATKAFADLPIQAVPTFPIIRTAQPSLEALLAYLQNPDWRYLFVVESKGRREVLQELLQKAGILVQVVESWGAFLKKQEGMYLLTGPLLQGFALPQQKITVIVEAQLFGETAVPQRRSGQKSVDPYSLIRNLAELTIGAPIVHLHFGVGRYQGLQTIGHAGQENDFFVISYANDDKIYVPVTALPLVSRYTGTDSEHAPLHKLGTEQWQKEKKKALEKVSDVAVELLEIYSQREAKEGFAYTIIQEEYEKFAAHFPFIETPDQITAMQAIMVDLGKAKPMDRLISGDVGFGKTEVAMRAAFLAVQNNKQVCVLAPTTLLAGQHFATFRDRFAEFPINIELLSRFRTAKESTEVMQALSQGKVDIIIGTHKLFSSHITYKDLGLLIIDEEHRFGVKQKEYIKALRTEVDILSMTATPIPRTLNMAMSGMRDISLITTPPAKRLAIKTFWHKRDNFIIKEALLREILRGGQVFFLHNSVQTIHTIAEELQTLLPEASIAIAHGQMQERHLEKVMSDFYHHRFQVLVCTTIIETGIDIPTANTIIIDKAHTFGLAQLHQLRGRVGRSHHQAYAYLLTPDEKLLTKDATKRLEAIVSLEDLGAGFTLAMHDLEIRGAGELLGEGQSGNMLSIGFHLYMEMLDKAVSDVKAGKTPELATSLHQGPEIELGISTILPESYMGDIHTRLLFYKRIAGASKEEELDDIQSEMIDRFGLLPPPAKQLFLITELKIVAEVLGITKIHAKNEQGRMEFIPTPSIHPHTLLRLLQLQPQRYQLDGPQRLKFTLDATPHPIDKIRAIRELLQTLSKEA